MKNLGKKKDKGSSAPSSSTPKKEEVTPTDSGPGVSSTTPNTEEAPSSSSPSSPSPHQNAETTSPSPSTAVATSSSSPSPSPTITSTVTITPSTLSTTTTTPTPTSSAKKKETKKGTSISPSITPTPTTPTTTSPSQEIGSGDAPSSSSSSSQVTITNGELEVDTSTPEPSASPSTISSSKVTSSSPSTINASPPTSTAPTSTSTPQKLAKGLSDRGFDPKILSKLESMFSAGKLTPDELDDRALDALKDYGPCDLVMSILEELEATQLEHVNNKSAFLCGLMKTHRKKISLLKKGSSTESAASVGSVTSKGDPISSITSSTPAVVNAPVASSSSSSTVPAVGSTDESVSTSAPQPGVAQHPGPNEVKLREILDRTGYNLDVTSGQRKYGGPPPNWENKDNPPVGSEVFVGKLPRDVFEDELIPLFEQVGTIWDLRLMIDPVNGFNKGFAFITYCNQTDANTAQHDLDGHEMRKGKSIKVNVSVPNHRLFVGNIPKSKSKEEILAEFTKLTAGLKEVIVYSSPDDRKKNRGFCFLEYDTHKSASLAKRKLSTGRTKVWGCDILVDWADPQEEPDHDTMSKVKVLYVRNLVAEVTEPELEQLFSVHGSIDRVKKIKDYAFVHFMDRDQATDGMNALNGHDFKGVKISVSLAKPPSDRKKKEETLRKREQRVTAMLQQRAMQTVAEHTMNPGNMPVMPMAPPPMVPNLVPTSVPVSNTLQSNANKVGRRPHQRNPVIPNMMQAMNPTTPYNHPRPMQPYATGANWYENPSWFGYPYTQQWGWPYSDPRSAQAAPQPTFNRPNAMGMPAPTHVPGMATGGTMGPAGNTMGHSTVARGGRPVGVGGWISGQTPMMHNGHAGPMDPSTSTNSSHLKATSYRRKGAKGPGNVPPLPPSSDKH